VHGLSFARFPSPSGHHHLLGPAGVNNGRWAICGSNEKLPVRVGFWSSSAAFDRPRFCTQDESLVAEVFVPEEIVSPQPFENARSPHSKNSGPPAPDRPAQLAALQAACELVEESDGELSERIFFVRSLEEPTRTALCLRDTLLSLPEARALDLCPEIRMAWDGLDIASALTGFGQGADGLFVAAPPANPDGLCSRVAGLTVLVGRPVRLAVPLPDSFAAVTAYLRAGSRWLSSGELPQPLVFVVADPEKLAEMLAS